MAAPERVATARREPASRPPRSGHGSMDWDDVRVFLAVARQGSMRAAGRALGLSQPTIARRLAAFEATCGGPSLFDRLPEGLRLSAAGERLVPAAESVEDAMLTLERRRAETRRHGGKLESAIKKSLMNGELVKSQNVSLRTKRGVFQPTGEPGFFTSFEMTK